MSWSTPVRAALACAPLLSLALVWGCANDAFQLEPPASNEASPSTKPKKDGGSSTATPSPSPDDDEPLDPEPDPDPTPDDGGTTTPKDAGTTPKDSGTPPPTAMLPAQGEVIISEVMFDPSGTEPDGEWFEIYNAASAPRTLSGLTIVDGGGRTHDIGAGVTLAAGAYAVFVRTMSGTTALPASAVVYEYGAGLAPSAGVILANGSSGALYLKNGATDIARAEYGGWFSMSGGESIQLKTLTYAAGANKSGWCVSAATWTGSTEKGTPGAAHDCP